MNTMTKLLVLLALSLAACAGEVADASGAPDTAPDASQCFAHPPRGNVGASICQSTSGVTCCSFTDASGHCSASYTDASGHTTFGDCGPL